MTNKIKNNIKDSFFLKRIPRYMKIAIKAYQKALKITTVEEFPI
jgi:hypothetical protein